MELTTNDWITGSEKGKRLRDQSEDVISSSSPVDRNSRSRRTQQVICTGTAPGILSSASGAFMMTQDKNKVFRLFDALSQEVLWMCDSRKELEMIEYCPVSDRIVACVSVPEPETTKACQQAIWDLNTGKVLLLPEAADRRHQAVLCINRAGTRIIVAQGYPNPVMLDTETGSELLRFQLNSGSSVMACCFTHDNSKVAIVSHTLSVKNYAVDIWEVAPWLGLLMFSRNVISPGPIWQVTSSFNSQMIAFVAGGKIVVMELSMGSHLLLSVTAEVWYGICFGCDDSCIVAVGLDGGSKSLGVYRIADSVALFRVPLQFSTDIIWGELFAISSKIYLAVRDTGMRSTVSVLDYATGATLQQSIVYKYPVAQLYVPEPEMILM
jgi:hypothetical protein